MRTSIEIEDRLYGEIKRRAASSSRTVREVIESALRAAFMGEKRKSRSFSVRPHDSPFKAGVDEDRLSKTIDDLEVEERLAGGKFQ